MLGVIMSHSNEQILGGLCKTKVCTKLRVYTFALSNNNILLEAIF